MLRNLSLFILLICYWPAKAQLDAGINGNFGFPMMFNDYVGDYHHALGSPGFGAVIRYKAPSGNIIPDIGLNRSSVKLPVTRFGVNGQVLDMHFNATSISLNGNLCKTFGRNEFYYGIGIGLSFLKGNSVSVSGDQSLVREVKADSSIFIKTTMPAINLNLEYLAPLSANSKVYAGVGFRLQYIYFFSKDSYRIDIVDNQYNYYKLQAQLHGHMLNPLLYLSLYYRFGERKD